MAITTPPFRTSLLTANGVPFATDNGDIQTTRDWWMYWNQLTDRSNSNSKLASEGSHASRPDAGSMPDGAIYIEADRGAIYSNEGGTWQYIAGTMYGTLSPDQRPTDLGAADAGFTFRGTDQPREFIWSGTAWVEVTAVQYGTHANRPNPTTIVEGALYVESDRGGVIYQRETPAGTPLWQYLAGTMWGTLSPDQRPVGLGAQDAGFDFRTTTAPPREFIWNQAAWIETTPVGGAAGLTHANVVTKVGTSGQIVEGGITDESAANSDKVHITASGMVGIGTTSATPLTVKQSTNGSGGGLTVQRFDTANTAAFFIGGDNQAYIQAGGAGYITLQTGGNLGIGTAGPGYQLTLAADSAGKPATSTWSVISDVRLKQNIEPVADDSLAILNSLDWIRYEYNGQANMPAGLKAIGLVAQQLRGQMPEAVRSTKTKLTESDSTESELLAIDYHHILVHSARAIQQLDAELKSLKALIGKPQP